jgi:hypothetical protein
MSSVKIYVCGLGTSSRMESPSIIPGFGMVNVNVNVNVGIHYVRSGWLFQGYKSSPAKPHAYSPSPASRFSMNSSDNIGHSRRGSCPVAVAEDGAKRSKFVVDERCQSMLLFCAAAGCIEECVECSAVLL